MMEYKLSKCEGCQLSDSIITRGVFAKSHIIEQMFPIICLQKLEKHSPHLSQKGCIHKFLLMLNICQIKCILKIKMVSSLMEPLHQQYLKDMIQSRGVLPKSATKLNRCLRSICKTWKSWSTHLPQKRIYS